MEGGFFVISLGLFTSHLLITFGVLALGVLGLVAGGKFLVDGAIALARLAGKRWMIGTTLLLLPLLRSGSRLSRIEGGLLLGVYATYIVLLLRG